LTFERLPKQAHISTLTAKLGARDRVETAVKAVRNEIAQGIGSNLNLEDYLQGKERQGQFK